MNRSSVRKKIADLLFRQRLGILATQGKGHPYQSIVSFSGSRDIKTIFFATRRSTRKYENLKRKAQVSIFLDTRSDQEADLRRAIGITALGVARELRGADSRKFMKSFMRNHPYLRELLSEPDCALFAIRVRSYYVVSNFQEVTEVRIP